MIDGYKWQEFIKCYLNYSLHQTDNGLNYISLADERSAFDLITTTKDGFLESDQSLNLANIEIVDKIYGIVTFKSLSSADKKSVISMLDSEGLKSTLNYLLGKWFQSSYYQAFYDYTDYTFIGQKWYKFYGIISSEESGSIAEAKINLESTTSKTTLLSTTSQGNGFYEIITLINDSNIGFEYQLTIIAEGFSEQNKRIRLDNKAFVHETKITLLRLGKATEELGGQIKAKSNEITVNIPPEAVDDDIEFVMSEIKIETNTESDEKQARFEINPSYEFDKPVKFVVEVTEALKSNLELPESEPLANNLALFTLDENNNLVLLRDSTFNPSTGKLTATTNHFSVFIVGPCGKNRCVTNIPPHPMASILDERVVNYPTDLPLLKQDAIRILNDNGWDSSNAQSMNLPEECNDTSCPPVEFNLKREDLNIPSTIKDGNLSIEYIEIQKAKVSGTAILKTQTEQCAKNPTANSLKFCSQN